MDLSGIKRALYIKLGTNGEWEKLSFKEGTLRLGYHDVPPEISRDRQAIKQLFMKLGRKSGAASNHARQVVEFYKAGIETLWITFSDGALWWCISESGVEYCGSDRTQYPNGSRLRRTEKWSNRDINGKKLIKSNLSGRLTKTEGYQGTICEIKGEDFNYLMRKIRGQTLPESERARELKAEVADSIVKLIRKLTPKDFELLVDLIFTQGGWRRIGKVGGTEKTSDIELIQPMTGERAIVQVKSQTNQRQLEEYIQLFREMPASRGFYAYHTAKKRLEDTTDPTEDITLTLLHPEQLAKHVLDCGLLDWLLEKVG